MVIKIIPYKKSQTTGRHVILMVIIGLLFLLAMAIIVWQSKPVIIDWFDKAIGALLG